MDFSDEMLEEILKIFQIESEEIIAKLNNNLLELEKTPNAKDTILMLFREAHTLKGASRMVGFNNVQAVAHKMEDVLGLAKDNELILNSEIINILYRTVDFLSELIQKSIQEGKEIYDENVSKQISILENAVKSVDETLVNNELSDVVPELLTENIEEINDLISESLFQLMMLEANNNSNLIQEFLLTIKRLYDIFNITGPYDIKKWFEDIKVKLDFITKASNSLTNDETGEIHQKIDAIINRLINLCGVQNINLIDYYALAFEKMNSKPRQTVMQAEKNNIKTVTKIQHLTPPLEHQPETTYTISEIQNRFENFHQEIESLNNIETFLIDLKEKSEGDNFKKILQKIIDIITFASKNNIKFDEETISVLKQSFEYCDGIMNNKGEIADEGLILQRLEIVRQVLELNNPTLEEHGFIPKNKYKIKKTRNADFSDLLRSSELKTLRVDSSKLDTLVSYVNELTITKIRTKKHLHKLALINKELDEWQKNSIKVLNYLKYYDKKYFQIGSNDNPVSFFVKQLLTSFIENNKRVQEAVTNTSNLYRTIQEDDMKMNVAVESIETTVKNIRILPLATVFHLFGRMVRDIAQEKNKKIELEIVGSETSTDKKIIEGIKAPLIHIIRNSIDHGIETPEERISLGKNPIGKIILSAKQINNKVIILIQDDGRGINIRKIKEKAVKKGYLTEEEISSMSDEQITNIIFAPGFSTGEEITSISGRGIGLDVVQTKILQLNGKVKVISELNKGCCIQIELPTTMSTMNAFIVESSNQLFAIPMDFINTVLRKKTEEIILNKGQKTIIFKEKTIPLNNLSDILSLPKLKSNKNKEIIFILQNDDKSMALSVDKLIGDQEILNKKLCAPLYKLKNISGITTLASGETCLILNIMDILATSFSKVQSSLTIREKSNSLGDYKILLVDDSITTRTLEKTILTKIGYNVETAENPVEAFEKMDSIKFDLIISDVEMPEMNGFEFLEKLKTNEIFSDIPIIMVSSLVTNDKKDRAIKLGAKKYMVKGEFDQENFQEIIDKILHKEI